MSGLPQLDLANPAATALAIEVTKLSANPPIVQSGDPINLEVEFHIGGSSAMAFQSYATPLNYQVDFYFESIGNPPGAGDEGTFGFETGTNGEGTAVPGTVPPNTLYKYVKSKSITTAPQPGTYKLSAVVTWLGVPLLGDFYGVIEGPILRQL